ncbi:aldo/keto reductase [Micromonospora rifamycinica]|uniref:aldo/keto reductase n=1 Tax=Micromonospora rifamycinica TaxID=291594 RepID=UPI003443062F
MRQVRLGNSGLRVSPLALGCMSYGDPGRGAHPWTLPEENSRSLIRAALEAGVTFFDTANIYSLGTSEEYLGRALRDFARREEVVIATKVFEPMHDGPLAGGLSRQAIMTEIDQSLRRLGTDYVDLYIVHRWDPHTPIEETMQALDDVVRAGKVRYLGASSMRTWQFTKAQHVAAHHGWTTFVSMQNHYNLLNREEEREMLPFCADSGVGVTPWSPLARGLLSRPWGTETERTTKDLVQHRLYAQTAAADRQVVDVVAQIATDRGISMAQVALAWLLSRLAVSGAVVGVTDLRHLTDAVAATGLDLDDDEIERLEKPYIPHDTAELQ